MAEIEGSSRAAFADLAAERVAVVITDHTDQVHKPPRGKSETLSAQCVLRKGYSNRDA
jgi:hypothetical protein